MNNLMTLPNMLFDVEKVALSEIMKGGITSGSNETAYAIVGDIDGQKQVLNVCSDRYHLVPNSEIFLPIEQELTNRGIKYKATYRNIGNQKFYADYIIEEKALQVGTDKDKIFPKIRVSHSYNGTLNYTVNMGYYRLICSNGLSVPVTVKGKEHHNFNVTAKHTPKLQENIDLFFEKLDYLLSNAQLLSEGFNKLASKTIQTNNLDRVMSHIMEKSGVIKAERKTKEGKNMTKNFEYAKEVALKEAKELNTDLNYWLIYNAINGAIFNDDLNKVHEEFRTKADVKVMDTMLAMA